MPGQHTVALKTPRWHLKFNARTPPGRALKFSRRPTYLVGAYFQYGCARLVDPGSLRLPYAPRILALCSGCLTPDAATPTHYLLLAFCSRQFAPRCRSVPQRAFSCAGTRATTRGTLDYFTVVRCDTAFWRLFRSRVTRLHRAFATGGSPPLVPALKQLSARVYHTNAILLRRLF